MIQLVSGVTRVGSRMYSPSDGPVALADAVEKRLVSAGVARYLYAEEKTEPAAMDDLRSPDSVSDAGQGETLPDAESVTKGAETPDTRPEPEDDGAELERVNFYDRDYLTVLTNARLKEIADGMDIDTSAMRRKADFVEAILQRQAADSGEAADDEEPPDLGAEEPVS